MSIRKHTAKNGTVTYYVYVTDGGGKPVYAGKRARKADARQLETDERARRQRLTPEQLDAAELTVEQAWKLIEPEFPARSRELYGKQWRLYIRDALGAKKLLRVTSGDVRALREAQLAKNFAESSVAFTMRVLRLFLNACVERKWLIENPARRATRGLLAPKHVLDGDEELKETVRFIPRKEDMARVLRAAPAGVQRDLIAFGMFTGCRIGEVCAVDWRDVHLDSSKLCVRRSVKGPTKSGKARWLPIQRQLKPILERRWLAQGRPARGRVFPEVWARRNPTGFVREWLNAAMNAAKIGHYTSHEAFRHTFASHFVMEGGNIFRLAKYLGHSDVKITYSIYAHLIPGAFADDEDRIVLPSFEGAQAEVVPLRCGD